MSNTKIIIFIVVFLIIIIFMVYIVIQEPNENSGVAAFGRYTVKCVPDCRTNEICIKGACVERQIKKPISL